MGHHRDRIRHKQSLFSIYGHILMTSGISILYMGIKGTRTDGYRDLHMGISACPYVGIFIQYG